MRTFSAPEAAERLGVSVTTIYAYVSRGLIRSEWSDAETREKRYVADDIERLRKQRDGRRDGRRSTAHGNLPLPGAIETKITDIEPGRIRLRGHDVLTLARNRSIGEVAGLVWLGDMKASEQLFRTRVRAPEAFRGSLSRFAGLSPVERFQTVLALASDDDASSWDLRAVPAARTGAAILQMLTEALAGKCFEASTGIADALRSAWAPQSKRATELIRAAIILGADQPADHATLVVRAVAAAGATPYAAVSGALSAFRGVRCGGAIGRIDALIAEIARPADAGAALRGRLERGEAIPGFGDPMHPAGDPRAALLLEMVDTAAKGSKEHARSKKLIEAADGLLGEKPTLEFAVVALARAMHFPADAPIALSALGRTIGWIGHAIEEYEAQQLAPPPFRYTGA
ncbi:MAG: citrate/2-methylcitrate synthase [Thermoanaerobaculia bacterium]|jgi:citrate synthase